MTPADRKLLKAEVKLLEAIEEFRHAGGKIRVTVLSGPVCGETGWFVRANGNTDGIVLIEGKS